MIKIIKIVSRCLSVPCLLFGCLYSSAQENVINEFKVPSIDEWQFKPITSFPCLILNAAVKDKLKKNYDLLSLADKRLELPVKAWITEGNADEKAKATQFFIKYWKDYNKKWTVANLKKDIPDGVGMRGIWRCIHLYDVVQALGTLKESERIEFRDSLVKSVELALGNDAKHPRITSNLGFRHMNIWGDVVLCAGITGMAFPELPQSKDWVEFAMNEVNWQLTTGEWDGCWHESARYHMWQLNICGQFFEILKNRTGIDMFQHPSIKRMCEWAVSYSTPLTTVPILKNPKQNGISLMPAIGDASWEPESYGMLNFYARQYEKSDPKLSEKLQWQWLLSGSTTSGCTSAMTLLIDPSLKSKAPTVLTSSISKRKGYLLMRDKFGSPDEVWFLQKSGEPSFSGHENADRNSFSLLAHGVPLAMDAGSGNYNDPRHFAWHKKTISHNAIIFEDPKHTGDILQYKSQKIVTGNVLAWKTTRDADFSSLDASAASEVERNVRNVLFVKPDYFVIYDEIKSKQNSYWLLHTPAEKFDWKEHSVDCITPWGVNLNVFVLSPERAVDTTVRDGAIGDWVDTSTSVIEPRTGQRLKAKGKENDFWPFRYQKYLAFPGKPNENFLVVLQPHRAQTPLLEIKKISDTKLVVQNGKRKDVIEFVDGGVKLNKGGNVISFNKDN